MEIKNISSPAFHRNGVCGEPFQVLTFEMIDGNDPARKMVAIRFKDDGESSASPRIAVLDIDLLCDGFIEIIDGNGWRGDQFANELDDHFTILQKD